MLICISDGGIVVGRTGWELVRRLAAGTALGAWLPGLVLGVLALLLLVVTFLCHDRWLPRLPTEKLVLAVFAVGSGSPNRNRTQEELTCGQ